MFLADDDGGLPSSDLLYPSLAQKPSAPAPSDGGGLPSSDLLWTAANVAASTKMPVGTGPAVLPTTAPVPMTEDEIAEAYGGNPITAVAQAAKKFPWLVVGALGSVGFIAWAMTRKKRGWR